MTPKPFKTIPEAEKKRLKQLVFFESQALSKGYHSIAGIDEAGRGPLAGPVVAAACIIPEGVFFQGVNDSKLLTPLSRKALFAEISQHPRVHFGIGSADVNEIDQWNILQATLIAMKRALDALPVRPDYLLADAVQLAYQGIPCEKLIKGDQRSQSIAAASILAKETRDRLMEEWHLQYPLYGFHQHKGYGTPQHLQALAAHGPCPLHRRSFEPVKLATRTTY